MFAMSQNVGGGVRIKPGKLCTRHAKTLHTQQDGRTAPVVRGHGAVPLRLFGNVVTRIGLQRISLNMKRNKNKLTRYRTSDKWTHPFDKD